MSENQVSPMDGMQRRQFGKLLSAAVAGLMAGGLVSGCAMMGSDKDKATCEGKDKATCEGKDKATCEGKDKATCEGKDKASCQAKS